MHEVFGYHAWSFVLCFVCYDDYLRAVQNHFFSFFSEEIFEECGAFIGADAGCNGSPVIEKRAVCQLEQGPYGTCLRVGAAVDYPVQTAVDDGSGAHGTGLTGDIERTAR